MANPLWQGDDGSTPNTWSTAANWDTGSVPVNSDSAYLRNSTIGIWAGLGQSAVTLVLLQSDATYSGRVGGTAAATNTLGSNYLDIGATNVVIGEPSTSGVAGSGSQRFKHNAGSVQCTWLIRSTAQASADAGLAPVRLKGTHASNKLYLQSGRVDVATEDPDETATLLEFSVTAGVTTNNTALTLGAGVTWTTGYITGGTLNLNSKGTTLNQQGGIVNINGSNHVRNITCGGTLNLTARFPSMAVSGITRSTTTATATVASTSTLATGDTVYITGADQAGYNGFKTITVASGTTFTFTTDDGDEMPATGTITAYKAIESLTLSSTGHVHFEGDSRPVHVKTISLAPGAQYTVNAASPSHVVFGTLTLTNAKNIKAA